MPHHAQDERHALAQTLRQAGPTAPTLCGAWTTAQLAAHLVLRERSVVELGGRLPVAALQRRAEAAVDHEATTQPYERLVEQVDAGPSWRDVHGPVPTAWAWSLPPVREAANLLEYAIHHEDVRRAGESWAPRELDDEVQAAVFQRLGTMAKLTLRHVPVGVELVAPGLGAIRTKVARHGGPTVTVTGAPLELALMAFGRIPQADVRWDGDPDDVDAVRGADISI